MTLLAVAAAVSLALVLGAMWGLYGRFGDRTEGFAAAIFLSNLPEGASGAKGMRAIGWRRSRILALWSGTALVLVVATLAGNLLFRHAAEEYLALMHVLAGGAIIASLATEIFPKAYRRDHHMAGIATALSLLAALVVTHTMTD